MEATGSTTPIVENPTRAMQWLAEQLTTMREQIRRQEGTMEGVRIAMQNSSATQVVQIPEAKAEAGRIGHTGGLAGKTTYRHTPLPEFNGKRSKFRDFISHMGFYFAMTRHIFPEERQRILFTVMRLKGEACRYGGTAAMGPSTNKQRTKLCDLLSRRYSPPAGMGGLASRFYGGLKEPMKDDLTKAGRPDGLTELIDRALELDRRRFERNQERKASGFTLARRPDQGNTPSPSGGAYNLGDPIALDATIRNQRRLPDDPEPPESRMPPGPPRKGQKANVSATLQPAKEESEAGPREEPKEQGPPEPEKNRVGGLDPRPTAREAAPGEQRGGEGVEGSIKEAGEVIAIFIINSTTSSEPLHILGSPATATRRGGRSELVTTRVVPT
ncbi:hypothetical protein FGG08_006117 [Glutinoglossum americanum]|uniref:Uncharacterized protein n=1 Tax=Glutinoglossum americanum TaxID=1670608 RepID=A0A9P8I460_9PEZI|nr:hypothetical protein FGG08_006117 [Glutinoglossum americanum]